MSNGVLFFFQIFVIFLSFFANTEKRADGVYTWPGRMTHSLAGTGLIDVTLLCLFFLGGRVDVVFFFFRSQLNLPHT
jgi:hypothetical protein